MNIWDPLCRARMATLNYFGFYPGHLQRCSEFSISMECPKCDFSAESADYLELVRSCAYHTATAHPEDEEFTTLGRDLLATVVQLQKDELADLPPRS